MRIENAMGKSIDEKAGRRATKCPAKRGAMRSDGHTLYYMPISALLSIIFRRAILRGRARMTNAPPVERRPPDGLGESLYVEIQASSLPPAPGH